LFLTFKTKKIDQNILFTIFVGNLKKQQALRERLNRGIAIDLEDGEFTVKNMLNHRRFFTLKFVFHGMPYRKLVSSKTNKSFMFLGFFLVMI
jgi:hypothetical protein